MPDRKQRSLLIFSDDWGRHPSSCQHLIARLLPRYEVHWVNTIGTRKPSWKFATLSRGLEKLRHWTQHSASASRQPPNLRVHNPKMWPSFSGFARQVNRELLLRQLGPLVRRLPAPVVAVTTLPLVADLVGRLPVARWVYYCVDDFGLWPGLDQRTLQAMETSLIHRVDTLIAVSETLQARLRQRGRQAFLLTHGVDRGFWQAQASHPPLAEFMGLARPLVLFWGVVDRRMDVGFVRQLSADMTRGTIVLLGPEADADPLLYECPRVHRLAPVAFDKLPHLARAADVLVMPYADLPVTQAIQPLKLKEYLATGKPVVARDLPATRPWKDCLDLTETAEQFSALVRERLAGGVPPGQARARARLDKESWTEKAHAFERWALCAEGLSA